jgi:hypothetical protein
MWNGNAGLRKTPPLATAYAGNFTGLDL